MSPQPQQPVAVEDRDSQRWFTPASANQSLVLVRRIVADIVTDYQAMMALRRERETLAIANATGERIADLDRQIEDKVTRLNALHGELAEIGCLLKDWAGGLVDFPARRDGRPVYLCWKLGEAAVEHWHDVTAGFGGRQPLDDGFDAPG